MKTEKRKLEHIEIVLNNDVQFKNKTTGLEKVELNYSTLPEISLDEVSLETTFLGKKFSAPLMVTAITGGVKEAEKINREIASACEEMGVGFGLGSQRAMLEDKKLTVTYQVRDVAPTIFLAGNIGATQLKNYSVEELEEMLETVQADALAIHCNAAQEAIQSEGTTDFKNCLNFIDKVSRHLKKPVIVKEVGAGISKTLAAKFEGFKVQAIDVAGAGGTSWTAVEYLRQGKQNGVFWDYGIPTAEALKQVKQVFTRCIIASGGIRTGLDVVKALSLEADLAGLAFPVLKAQHLKGGQGVKELLEKVIQEIKVAMFLNGAKSIAEIH